MKVSSRFPIKLTNARVWRTYIGGKMIDALQGGSDGGDSHFPEEWIMSVVAARNPGREIYGDEGLSFLSEQKKVSLKMLIESNPVLYLGEDHVNRYGMHTGFLVKLIDSAERLTVQVHPNRNKAMQLFNSKYGKTECWHILQGREIDGEPPCIYLGFKAGVKRVKWERLFRNQDIQGMLECLHKIEVKEGETYLVEGGIPHAIGEGCFLVEIQEPTDYTIRVERVTPSGFRVLDQQCHQGIGFERMFDCFEYDGFDYSETIKRFRIIAGVSVDQSGGKVVPLVGYQYTPYFKMDLLESRQSLEIDHSGFSGLYILAGKGTLCVGTSIQKIKSGEQYFIPAGVNKFALLADENHPIKAINCFGPL